MHCSKITKLRSHQNELYQELSDLESEVIAGGINSQPLPLRLGMGDIANPGYGHSNGFSAIF